MDPNASMLIMMLRNTVPAVDDQALLFDVAQIVALQFRDTTLPLDKLSCPSGISIFALILAHA